MKVELVVEGKEGRLLMRWDVKVFKFSWQAAGQLAKSELVAN